MVIEIFIFCSAILAFGLSSIIGGGASIILIPVLALVLPISEVPSALVVGTFTSSLSRSVTLYRKIRWNLVFTFVPAALPSVALGAWMLRYVDPLIVTWICALFLVSNLSFLFRGESRGSISATPVKKSHVIGIGFLAGLISGITGAIGLVFNGFYLKSGLDKEEIVATRAANEILLHLLKLVLYLNFGLFSINSFCIGGIVAIAALLSSFIMRTMLSYFSDDLFRRVGFAAMAGSGIFLFAQTSTTIFKEKTPSIRLVSVENGIETKVGWGKKKTAFEIEYDGEVSIERVVSLERLPTDIADRIHPLIESADDYVIDEVYGWSKHYYEVYLDEKGKIVKYEITPRKLHENLPVSL